MKKYIVKLEEEEREELRRLITQGQASARKLAHARILVKADSGEGGLAWSDQAISEALEVGTATVERVRQRFVEEGMQAALRSTEAQQTVSPQIGRSAGSVSHRTDVFSSGGRAGPLDIADAGRQGSGIAPGGQHSARNDPTSAQKNELKPWLKKQWCIPPKSHAEFVSHMEDVLEVYKRPYDPAIPTSGVLDETSQAVDQ